MHNKHEYWIVVTAGLGSQDFEQAAKRVAKDFAAFDIVTETIVVQSENLSFWCPKVSSMYSDILQSSIHGYGYMSWKAEIVKSAFEYGMAKYSSSQVGVIWVDAGCEVFYSFLSNIRLKLLTEKVKETALLSFSLKTPETQYSKQEVLSYFNMSPTNYASAQKQTTFFLLYGQRGYTFAQEWTDVVLQGKWLVDETLTMEQLREFIAHRHDQSIFSLLAKRSNLTVEFSPPPKHICSSIGSVRALSWPVWASRNRTGTSSIPRWLTSFLSQRKGPLRTRLAIQFLRRRR